MLVELNVKSLPIAKYYSCRIALIRFSLIYLLLRRQSYNFDKGMDYLDRTFCEFQNWVRLASCTNMAVLQLCNIVCLNSCR